MCKDVLQFAYRSKEKLDQLFRTSSNGGIVRTGGEVVSSQVSHPRQSLCTAAVMAGVSLADHQLLFHSLMESLKTCTPHVATLRARVCNPGREDGGPGLLVMCIDVLCRDKSNYEIYHHSTYHVGRPSRFKLIGEILVRSN